MEEPDLTWRKASRSSNGGGNCVEVAATGDHVFVRDSKSPERGHLAVSRETWRMFVTRITNKTS